MMVNEAKVAPNRLTAEEGQQIVVQNSGSWSSVFGLSSGRVPGPKEEVICDDKQVVGGRAESKQRREWRSAKRLNLFRRQLFRGLMSGGGGGGGRSAAADGCRPETAVAGARPTDPEPSSQQAAMARKQQLGKRTAPLTSGQRGKPNGAESSSNSNHDENTKDRCCLSLSGRKSQQNRFSFLSRLEVKRRRSLSPAKPFNHLVRMIVDKNTLDGTGTNQPRAAAETDPALRPKAQREGDSGIEASRDMVILLGSSRCPSVRPDELPGQATSELASPSQRSGGDQGDNQRAELGGQRRRAASGGSEPDQVPAATKANQQQQLLRVNYRKQSSRTKGAAVHSVDRMGQLIGLLDQYAKQIELGQQQSSVMDRAGSPSSASSSSVKAKSKCNQEQPGAEQRLQQQQKHQLRPSKEEEQQDSMFYLEESWSSFVNLEQQAAKEGLDEDRFNQRRANLKIQQDAIWELLATEVFYIKRLRVIIDLFLSTLANLQQHSLLLEIDADRMASNVREIYEANLSFWKRCLQPMLSESRATRSPLDPRLMRTAFAQIRSMFQPYTRYCLEHTACLDYVKEKNRTSEYFKVYLAWCECQKDCERLRLMDLLAKPMQRLTRYSLLFKTILKKTDNREQCQALEEMIGHMNRFVLTVDLELRKQDELDRLVFTEQRLDSYDIGADVYTDEIDRLVKNYCHFELMKPLFNCAFNCRRQLVYDSQHYLKLGANSVQFGQVRFKDAQASGKLDVVLLIFTDHLFICKQTSPSRLWPHSAFNHSVQLHQRHRPQNSSLMFQAQSKSKSRQTAAAAVFCAAGSPSSGHSPTRKPLGGFERPNHGANPLLEAHKLCGSRPSIGSQSSLNQTSGDFVAAKQASKPLTSQRRAQSVASSAPPTSRIALPPAELSAPSSDATSNSNQDSPVQSQQRLQAHPINNAADGQVRKTRAASGQFLLAEAYGSSANKHNNKPAHYASTSSLMGAAAREFFARSSDNSRSGDLGAGPNQASPLANTPDGQQTAALGAAPKSASSNRLRVIRSPYPIERLVMHELKDGQSVLCCQLNDSQTIATSFVLYTSSPSAVHLLNEPARLTEQRSRSSNHLKAQQLQDSSRSDSDSLKLGVGSARPAARRSSDSRRQSAALGQLTPAGQLINLIKQAQARYQCAADFHGVKLRQFTRAACGFVNSSSANKAGPYLDAPQHQQTSRNSSRLSKWSSFRSSTRGTSAKQPPLDRQARFEPTRRFSTELIDEQDAGATSIAGDQSQQGHWLAELEVSPQEQYIQECLGGNANTSVQRQSKQSNLIAKVVVEQHQYMLLNHGLHDQLSQFDYRCQLSADRTRLQVSAQLIEESAEQANRANESVASSSNARRDFPHTSRQWLCGSSINAGSQSSVFDEPIAGALSNISCESQLPTPSSCMSLSCSRKNSMLPGQHQHRNQRRPDQLLQGHETGDSTTGELLLSPNRVSVPNFSTGCRRYVSSDGLRLVSAFHSAGRGHFSRSARVANQLELSSDNEPFLVTRKGEQESSNTPAEPAMAPLPAPSVSNSANYRSLVDSPVSTSSAASTGSSSSAAHLNEFGGFCRRSAPKEKPIDGEFLVQRRSRPIIPQTPARSVTTEAPPLSITDATKAKTHETQSLRRSGRRNLSLLKRQNVIISASSDHHQGLIDPQPTCYSHTGQFNDRRRSSNDTSTMNTSATTTSGPSTSVISSTNAAPSNSVQRHFQTASQATTMDQTSVTLDDSNVPDWLANLRLTSLADGQAAPAALDYRAMSFELGNLRNLNPSQSTDILLGGAKNPGEFHHIGADCLGSNRSASMETRSPVSVTLTLPNNEQLAEEDLDESLIIQSCNRQVRPNVEETEKEAFHLSIKEREADSSSIGSVYLNIPQKRQLHNATKLEENHWLSQNSTKNHNPPFDDYLTEPTWVPESWPQKQGNGDPIDDDQVNRSANGEVAISSESKRVFNFCLKTNQDTDPVPNPSDAQNLPVLNVITASPITLDSNCEFSNETSAELSYHAYDYDCSGRPSPESATCHSSPDWPSDMQTMTDAASLMRRSSSTTRLPDSSSLGYRKSCQSSQQIESSTDNCSNISSIDESVHFLKKFQTLLMFHRRRKKPSTKYTTKEPESAELKGASRKNSSRLPSTSRTIDGQKILHDKTNSSVPMAGFQFGQSTKGCDQSYPELIVHLKASDKIDRLQDGLCCGNLLHVAENSTTPIRDTADEENGRERQLATGYLGFYEKLDLHNRLVRGADSSLERKDNVAARSHTVDELISRGRDRLTSEYRVLDNHTTIVPEIAIRNEPSIPSNQRRRKASLKRGRSSASSTTTRTNSKRDPFLANITNQRRSALKQLKTSLAGETIHYLSSATSLRNRTGGLSEAGRENAGN